MNNSFTHKRTEWNNQALSNSEHSKQVLRPIDKKDFQNYIEYILNKLQLSETTDYFVAQCD